MSILIKVKLSNIFQLFTLTHYSDAIIVCGIIRVIIASCLMIKKKNTHKTNAANDSMFLIKNTEIGFLRQMMKTYKNKTKRNLKTYILSKVS